MSRVLTPPLLSLKCLILVCLIHCLKKDWNKPSSFSNIYYFDSQKMEVGGRTEAWVCVKPTLYKQIIFCFFQKDVHLQHLSTNKQKIGSDLLGTDTWKTGTIEAFRNQNSMFKIITHIGINSFVYIAYSKIDVGLWLNIEDLYEEVPLWLAECCGKGRVGGLIYRPWRHSHAWFGIINPKYSSQCFTGDLITFSAISQC